MCRRICPGPEFEGVAAMCTDAIGASYAEEVKKAETVSFAQIPQSEGGSNTAPAFSKAGDSFAFPGAWAPGNFANCS